MPISVAPHVGAWIETLRQYNLCRGTVVAPHVGAWIETLRRTFQGYTDRQVAPHVGAWIETDGRGSHSLLSASRPTWARGLKLLLPFTLGLCFGRAPRGRVD